MHKILGASLCCGAKAAGGGDELVVSVLLTRVLGIHLPGTPD